MRLRTLALAFATLVASMALGPLGPAGLAQDTDDQDPREMPWIGIGLDGAKISSVAIDSPAMRGGLQSGDLLLACDDTPIGVKTGLADLLAFLKDKKPGELVKFKVKRGDRELTLSVTLGSRLDAIGPMARGGRKAWRENAVIFPALVNYESSLKKRLDALLDDPELYKAWLAQLAARRKKLADTGKPADPRLADSTLRQEWAALTHAFRTDESRLPGFYKLERETYVRRAPLKFEKVTRDWLAPLQTAAFAASPDLARVVAQLADGIDIAGVSVTASTPPQATSFRALITPLVDALREAGTLYEKAFALLNKDEREFLSAQLPKLAHKFVEHIYLQENSTPEALRANLRALDLSKRTDYQALSRAIATPLAVLTPDYLARLKQVVPKKEARALSTPLGTISVNGGGDLSKAVVIIDRRGDTTWSAEALSAPRFGETRVLIDLAGDDTYNGGPFGSIGAAIGGTSIVIDTAGNDRYLGRRLTQGAALLGGGILWDLAGNDTYLGDAYVGGAAIFGIGLLLDSAGNDTKKASIYAWGLGGPKGAGACLDALGEDHSIAGGKYPTSYGAPPGEYEGNSFGLGIGFRQIAAGGLGVYVDGAGNDQVSAGEFSLGGAYFLGYGIYHDKAGDDIVHSSRYGVGFGVHSAVGIALDDGGNDLYDGQTAASLGSAWDLGVGMLIDASGDDVYVCDGLGLGGAAQNGVAVLWDKAGNDVYRGKNGTQGQGTSFEYGAGRGAKNFALLLDDAGKDTYNRKLADGETKLRGTIGLAQDR